MIAGSYPAVSLVSINPAGFSQSSGPRRSCVGTGPLSLLLALEVAPTGRASAARIDPADERRKSALGAPTHSRRTTQARLRSRSRASLKYMVNRRGPPARDGDLLAEPRARHCPMDLFVVPTIVSTCSMP